MVRFSGNEKHKTFINNYTFTVKTLITPPHKYIYIRSVYKMTSANLQLLRSKLEKNRQMMLNAMTVMLAKLNSRQSSKYCVTYDNGTKLLISKLECDGIVEVEKIRAVKADDGNHKYAFDVKVKTTRQNVAFRFTDVFNMANFISKEVRWSV